jgi:hypothetical protein
MTLQTPSAFVSDARPTGVLIDAWPLVAQALQGAVAVCQLLHCTSARDPLFGKTGTGLRPLFDATTSLIHSTDRAMRLMQALPEGPLERPFGVGAALVELEGQDLREFGSLLSALCIKTSSAHSWSIMLGQHNAAIAREIRADVAALGDIGARIARLHAGPTTNRRVIEETLEILGVFYDAMNRRLEPEAV